MNFVEFFKSTFFRESSTGCFFIKDLFLSIFYNEKKFQINLFQPSGLTSSNISFYITK